MNQQLPGLQRNCGTRPAGNQGLAGGGPAEQEFQYFAPPPYPAVRVTACNRAYADTMLVNLGSCDSEMTAVSRYFYNDLILEEQWPRAAECFHKISMVEMHHLHIFGELAYQLGADPRLWCAAGRRMNYWSPRCNPYPRDPWEILTVALAGEEQTIRQYRQQAGWIRDTCIVENLERIILDEECHVRIFQSLIQELEGSAADSGVNQRPQPRR